MYSCHLQRVDTQTIQNLYPDLQTVVVAQAVKHATQGNDRLGQNQCGGANVGNFLPLGISLNHLNAIGQQMHGQSGNESKQYDELTDKLWRWRTA